MQWHNLQTPRILRALLLHTQKQRGQGGYEKSPGYFCIGKEGRERRRDGERDKRKEGERKGENKKRKNTSLKDLELDLGSGIRKALFRPHGIT